MCVCVRARIYILYIRMYISSISIFLVSSSILVFSFLLFTYSLRLLRWREHKDGERDGDGGDTEEEVHRQWPLLRSQRNNAIFILPRARAGCTIFSPTTSITTATTALQLSPTVVATRIPWQSFDTACIRNFINRRSVSTIYFQKDIRN